jgi:hypothetical protein
MRFHHAHRSIPAVLAAAALVLATGIVTPAAAGDRGQQGVHRAQHGGQKARPHGDYTRHTEVCRTDTGHSRTDTWSSERGTSTRQADVVNDRANRTRRRDVVWTGPQGGTSTRDVTAVRDPATGTWTRDVAVDRTPPPKSDGG